MEEKAKIVKISKPERVDRILERVCSAGLEVLIRTKAKRSVAVRGKAEQLFGNAQPPSFLIGNISYQGIQHLWNAEAVQIEFVGMSTQIVFRSKVVSIGDNMLRVEKPRELISYDRRANARHGSTDRNTVFADFSGWQPERQESTAPVFFAPFNHLSSWLQIADMSEGGFCAVSRFPGILSYLGRGVVDQESKLIFPMHTPIAAPLEIRWTRRVKENLVTQTDVYNQQFFRIGAQFVDPSDELKMAIKQFIHQLSVADAI